MSAFFGVARKGFGEVSSGCVATRLIAGSSGS